jgi:NitT/TauT family transport system permease protein/sulfonate transport system permease protein
LKGVALVVALLVLWEVSARSGLVQSANWPPFSAVVVALVHGILNGELIAVIGSSLWRMTQGYVLGSVIGIATGVALAMFRPVRYTLMPAIELVRPIPITALIPPLIFVLGIEDKLKIFCIALSVFFPVALNTMAGVAGVDSIYGKVARTFGVPPATMIRRVILPAAMPLILAGLRTGLAIALIVTVISEMIAGQQGVGYYLMSMEFAMRASDMYAVVILLTLVAYAINRLFLLCEARVIHWARTAETASA